MPKSKPNFNDLYAFYQVAHFGSFTKASQTLGVSQSALSHTIKTLEHRLSVKLFYRTTRRLALTQQGQGLFDAAKASFDNLNGELTKIANQAHTPSGKVRINASFDVIFYHLLPRLAHFGQDYPEIELEFTSHSGFSDIVGEQFDAGVRLGADVGENMVAVRISKPLQMALAGSPSYFKKYGFPKALAELDGHHCLGYQLQKGGVFDWTFEKDSKTHTHTPKGNWTFNDSFLIVQAAKMGLGLVYEPVDLMQDALDTGELIRVMPEYSQHLDELYLYYPHREISQALRVVVETLKI